MCSHHVLHCQQFSCWELRQRATLLCLKAIVRHRPFVSCPSTSDFSWAIQSLLILDNTQRCHADKHSRFSHGVERRMLDKP
jgi:hypothetical protein